MKTGYDVIIVGAGPGGLSCAENLKDSALSVLLIEKNSIIGPKICAGGLTYLTSDFSIPSSQSRSFAKHHIYVKDKPYEVELEHPIRTMTRYDLGQYQLGKIKDAQNITILTGTSVKEIKNNKIETSKGEFSFKYLVGSDGSTSTVRRSLGLPLKICMGLYYDIQEVTNDFKWYLNPDQFSSGYIWTFPHKEFTNIGIFFNPERLASIEAKQILQEYLRGQGYQFSEETYRGAPVNYLYKGFMFNNVFLVGDAAGLASKTTGEGISFALISGREVARKILDPAYTMPHMEKLLKIKRRQERMLDLLDRFPSQQTRLFRLAAYFFKFHRFQRYFGN